MFVKTQFYSGLSLTLASVSLFLFLRNNLAQLKDAYTKLFEDYNEMKEERKRREVTMGAASHDWFSDPR